MLDGLDYVRKHPLLWWFGIPAALISAWLKGDKNTPLDVALILLAGALVIVLADLAVTDYKDGFRLSVRLILGCIFIWGGVYTYNRIFKAEQVQVTLRYAYEECAYRGAVIHNDEDRIVLPKEPIVRKFQPSTPYAFRFGIHKGNRGLAMRNVILQVVFLVNDNTIAKGFSIEPTPKKGAWQEESVSRRFSTWFAGVTDQDVVPDAALQIKFPERGNYDVVAKIDGDGLESIYRHFQVRVADNCG